jgi:hypothetical protein
MTTETYYPAHASLRVEELSFPGPSAWGTGAEMMAQLVRDLKAKLAEARVREVTRLGEDCAAVRAAVDAMAKGRAA